MTFVIVNKELDLSVGSTFGLTATVFGMLFAPTYFDLDVSTAVLCCLALGLAIGLINGFLVTILEVPAFIATLTMLFIGRGVILGLTGGKNIAFEIKADQYDGFLPHRRGQRVSVSTIRSSSSLSLRRSGRSLSPIRRIGWTTYATGGNEQAARYAGINTRFVRMRSYVLSSLCAVIAGLMNVAQSKDADPLFGIGAELIAIASVIVGGAAIFGGRGRVIGSCLGAIFVGLIDKVLREGVPITRIIEVGGEKMEVAAVAQLPPGAVPAFLGVVLIIAVLVEPWLVRRRVARASLGVAARPAAAGRFPISAASRSPARKPAARRRRRAASANGGLPHSSIGATRRRSCWWSRSGCSASGRGRISGRGSTIPSRSCWPSPRSRCSRSD